MVTLRMRGVMTAITYQGEFETEADALALMRTLNALEPETYHVFSLSTWSPLATYAYCKVD